MFHPRRDTEIRRVVQGERIMKQIPFASPDIGEKEIGEVSKTLRSGWLTMGRKTIEFEEALKKFTGAKEAIAANSCTAALHLSLLAAGIGPGDEVITTPFTFAATANVIVHTGAKPVFVDIDPDTFNIDPEKIEAAITDKTRAILPVHYAGQPCDMASIQWFADEYDLDVIEDAAHAIGSAYRGRKIGNLGSLSTCFSFYATKNMTTGEGGAVATNDEMLATKIRNLRLHGMSKDAWKRYGPGESWKYDIIDCGWKYNTTDINATLGLCQLEKLVDYTVSRRRLAAMYTDYLSESRRIVIPPVVTEYHARHLYPILVEKRNKFIEEMTKRGVSCSVHFVPLHLTKFYQSTGYAPGMFPVCEEIANHIVSLPLYPKMTDEDAMYVIECAKEITM